MIREKGMMYAAYPIYLRHKSSALCYRLCHRTEHTFATEHIVPKFDGGEVRIPCDERYSRLTQLSVCEGDLFTCWI